MIFKETIARTFLERVFSHPGKRAFYHRRERRWESMTFESFYAESELLSHGLTDLGIQTGDKIALMSNTRLEWTLSDIAIMGAGAITVPIYPSTKGEELRYIVHHSEARLAILESPAQFDKLTQILRDNPKSLPYLEKIILVTGDKPPSEIEVLSFAELRERGRARIERDPDGFQTRLKAIKPEDIFSICYTSGTTGVPKGAVLTHRNLMSVLKDCGEVIGMNAEAFVTVTFLPFSHILGRLEALAIFAYGWTEYFADQLDELPSIIREVKPTGLFAVPRMFEKAYEKVQLQIGDSNAFSKRVFQWALDVAHTYWNLKWEGREPPLATRASYKLAKKLVFQKILDGFGGRLSVVICGGAPLSAKLGEFFHLCGIQVMEGYGLTETCAPVCLNTPENYRFGSVGRPLPEVSIKTSQDGEILVKSEKVFRGYYKMKDETDRALKGGWLHTGDIGHIDSDGYVFITDRKKDIIITSAGKNIAPQKIENLARAYPLIGDFLVFGDGKKFLTALVTLDREETIRFASENHILFSGFQELTRHPKIRGQIEAMIGDLNSRLASFETIKRFRILPNEFSVEGGELTPSLKVKRREVSQKFERELLSLYS